MLDRGQARKKRQGGTQPFISPFTDREFGVGASARCDIAGETLIQGVNCARFETYIHHMTENYSEAAVRHFQDSIRLAAAIRWGNAGHLVGFAAECAVKHRLQTLRPSARAPHGHFPDLINIAKKHLASRRDATLHGILKMPTLMQGWDVNDRYAENSLVGKPQYDLWRNHAARLMSAAGLKR